MTEPEKNVRNQYFRMAAMFLAEGLRTRRMTLKRASEIGEKILLHAKLLDTEAHFLSLIKEMSIDYEELSHLHKDMQQAHVVNQTKNIEQAVKDFVIQVLPVNMPLAMEILQETRHAKPDWAQVRQKYPLLSDYLNRHGFN